MTPRKALRIPRWAGPAFRALVLTAALPGSLLAQRLSFKTYDAEQGLPQMQVAAVHQTRDGFLWVGTWAGLSRFDGRVFDTWTDKDGLSVNAVISLLEVGSGSLAVGTYGGGICYLDAGVITSCIREADGLPSGEVNVLTLGEGDDLWAGTSGGVALIRGREVIRTLTTEDGLPDPFVSSVVRDEQGRWWFGTRGGSVRLDGNRLVADPLAPAGAVIASTSDGLLFTSDTGLTLWMAGTGEHRFLAEVSPGMRVPAARVAPDGTLWITTTRGALRVRNGVPELLTRASGLPGDQINDIHIDLEENVWFATEYGISKLVPGPFLFYTEEHGLPSSWIGAITEEDNGRVWVSTALGPAYLDGSRFQSVERPLGQVDNLANGLAADPSGGVLLGSLRGLYRLDDGSGAFRWTDVSSEHEIEHLLTDGNGILVAAVDDILRWEGGVLSDAGVPPLDGRPVSMARDAAGRLWVGMLAGGVRVIEAGSIRSMGAAEGLSDQAVWALEPAADGGMWIGTNGDGAYHVTGDSIRHLTTDDGLASDYVWQLLVDSRGSLWIFTGHGMNRITDGQMHSYGTGQGLTDLEGSASAALEDSQGRLWFGTGSGVYRYEPLLDRENPVAPPIYITGLTGDGLPYPLEGARIPPGVTAIRIRASAPSFRDESAVRFSYRLPRLGETWSEPSSEAGVTLAGLPPGRHVVEMKAINDDGIESLTAATIVVTVLPRFWQTLWFRGIGLVLLLLGLAGTPWLRARKLEAEREEVKAALRVSEQRILDIVEHSSNLFYAHGPDHVLTYVSPLSNAFFGCPPEDALVSWTEFLTDHPDNASGIQATERALSTGVAQPPFELELKGVDGRKIRVEVREAPVIRDGRAVAIVGSLTDITDARIAAGEKRRLEEQLQQAQRLEALGRLAGGVAHDFNNLLTAVLGHAQLLKGDLAGDPLSEDVAQIELAANRGAALVQQLLAFSRRQIVMPEILDLNETVHESAGMLNRILGDSIAISWVPWDGALTVQADRTQLALAIINLAVNARDAMPAGGQLTMATTRVDLSEARPYPGPDEVPPGSYAQLTLSDTGTGIEAKVLEHVFDPFFTTKTVGAGTGLGLATVYGAVKQNGGHIQVETTPGEGTTFRILMPLF